MNQVNILFLMLGRLFHNVYRIYLYSMSHQVG